MVYYGKPIQEDDMTAKQLISAAASYAGISRAEVARRLKTSPQQLDSRLNTGKFTLEEWDTIINAIGAEFIVKVRFPDGREITK